MQNNLEVLVKRSLGISESLFSFATVCMAGVRDHAEHIVTDYFSFAFEAGLITFAKEDEIIREELFAGLWKRIIREQRTFSGENKFYQLPLVDRAIVYLKIREKFSFVEISRILSKEEHEVETVFARSCECLLGRPLADISEDF